MHYHIILTELCDSRCRYCYEKSFKEFDNGLEEKFEFNFTDPPKSEVKIETLKEFLSNDPEPTLIFYGGEPLLEIDKIKEIIENIDCKFRMQTNAKLLKNLPIDYLKKIGKILVSIDGTKERTDFNRGSGTYDQVIQNIRKARELGYTGEIVARMTISKPDIFSQVKHLLSLQGIFDSIHWQLDAGFYKYDFDPKKFEDFSSQYNKEIDLLIDFWADNIKKGKVIKLYPFLGIINRLLGFDKSTNIMCGAGHSGYTITTSGKISACPIMNNIKTFECGNIEDGLIKKIDIINPCTDCEEKRFCGGRCLYSNYAKLWGDEGEKMICQTIRHLISKLRSTLPEIKEAIEKGIITKQDLSYEKYFGPEIIP